MAHYSSDKRPAELDAAAAIADADVMVIQKDGENFTRKVPFSLVKAQVSGGEFRTNDEVLAAGPSVVIFTLAGVPSPMSTADYEIFYYVLEPNNYAVDIKVSNLTAAGFSVDVSRVCTIYYYAIPKN